jgi:prephenate dehydrogenase
MTESRITGSVRVVGTGLLGASIGLALSAKGVDVILDDASPSSVELAVDYGAGRPPRDDDEPSLVVVCVPPDVTATVVFEELAAFPDAVVTDVASVKLAPLESLRATGADVSRYVGSHPMAGRERGGAASARADLFVGRPWVIARHDGTSGRRATLVEDLALDLGAVPISMNVEEHDESVALVSHVPQVIASLLAARLSGATDSAVSLAGQGLRDSTRIAASAPELWVQILAANAAPTVDVLRSFRVDLDRVIRALDAPQEPGARKAIAETISSGNDGVSRIPGKHGGARQFSQITVKVDDKPGELARLLTEIGELGVNMEDLRLEHSPGAQIGIAEIAVVPEAERNLVSELAKRGWKIAGAAEQ